MAKKTIAFEIGTEELPAFELHNATVSLSKNLKDQFSKSINFDDIQFFTTPRRIVVLICGVPEKIEACREEYEGPKTSIAFVNGQPTKAAIGFARGKGIDPKDLEVREIDGQEYIFAIKNIPEQNISDLLPDLFLNFIDSISWKKTQRWGDQSQQFARPIRWIFAMFGDNIIELEYAGVKSSNITFGHRFLAPGPYVLDSADKLIPQLKNSYLLLSEEDREKTIRDQVSDIEKKYGLTCELNSSTLQEVVNLCEYPTAMVGKFDESFLEVPKEIIVDAMLVHQRYFPLFDKDGSLTNKFVIVSNGDPKNEYNIVDGNQRVVAARLYDAKFFFQEDKKKPLSDYFEKLNEVVFAENLGTMKDKGARIAQLSKFIAADAGLDEQTQAKAELAGKLSKCDLVTNAVCEFTSVQGVMGMYYAQACGVDDEIALAIGQHYRPKFSGDELPENNIGKCVAAADKIDSLCGMFAANMIPTGSSDPFALRRGAIGVLSIICSGLNFSLENAINKSLDLYSEIIEFDKQEVYKQVIDFVLTRTKVMLKDNGFSHDTIEAVASANVNEPYFMIKRVEALESARKNDAETFDDLATAFSRANNLRDKKLGIDFDSAILNEVEKQLVASIGESKLKINKACQKHNYKECVDELARLRGPIDTFYEKVMIMDEDEKIRENRLKILNAFIDVFSDIANFDKMSKK